MLVDDKIFKCLAGGVKQSTWDKWDNSKKQEYIKKHPNSKYAKKETDWRIDRREKHINELEAEKPNMTVCLWPFEGYSMIPIEVYSEDFDYTEALEKAVALYGEGPALITMDKFVDRVKDYAEENGLIYDDNTMEDIEQEYEGYANLIYVDSTEYGGECGYVSGENIRFEEGVGLYKY